MSPWRRDKTAQGKLTFGKYILDSLSIGMYSHPLMSLREYVQNSTDAIDCLPDVHGASIEIVVDGRKRSLTIHDNGVGISSNKAKSTLLNIGCSDKNPTLNRGFRGIGRLGGLSYCDELRFVTKNSEEDIISICIWDCKRLRQLIADPAASLDTESLIKVVSTFKQQKYPGPQEDHFFKVEMNMIHNGKNGLLNVPEIRSYLSQVAPVPFHPAFRFGQLIDKELMTRAPSYRTYSVLVNGQQIHKPYRDVVSLSKGTIEAIKKISFVEMQGESEIIGFGWLGELSLQGIVSPSTDMDGLRLRYGNMLIGNKDTLSGLFREKRFNNYLVGEIHVCSKSLTLNSRRDDFEDSPTKDELYGTFIREVGIPFSREIRHLSSKRSNEKNAINLKTLLTNASMIIDKGYVSELQRDDIVNKLRTINGNGSDNDRQLAAELIQKLSNSRHVLSVLNSKYCSNDDIIDLFRKTLDVIYSGMKNRVEPSRLCEKMYLQILQESGDTASPINHKSPH